jgi:hypothetical protein
MSYIMLHGMQLDLGVYYKHTESKGSMNLKDDLLWTENKLIVG